MDTIISWILPTQKLRLNCIKNMNDPSESLTYITDFYDKIVNSRHNSTYSLDDQFIASRFQNETKILSFSVDREVEQEQIKRVVKGFQLQRMWAQYADNSAGVCIVLDYDRFIEENRDILHSNKVCDDKVTYKLFHNQIIPAQIHGIAVGSPVKSTCTCSHVQQLQVNKSFVSRRFFEKNIDWEGESEYRFLTFVPGKEEITLSIESSIEKIILGINFSKHHLPSIEGFIDRKNISVIEIDTNSGEYLSRGIDD